MPSAQYQQKVAGIRAGDPINDLGVQLARPIPNGTARTRWLSTKAGRSEAVDALRNAGYSGNMLARAMFDLSYGEIRLPLRLETQADLVALDGGVIPEDEGVSLSTSTEGERRARRHHQRGRWRLERRLRHSEPPP